MQEVSVKVKEVLTKSFLCFLGELTIQNWPPLEGFPEIINQTRELEFHRDILTPRRELKLRRSAIITYE